MEFKLRKFVPGPIVSIAKDDLLCRKIHATVKSNETFWYGMFFVVVSALAAFWRIRSSKLVGDEIFHFGQIRLFDAGKYQLNPDLTIIPTYHLIISLLTRLVGNNDLIGARFFSMVLCLIAIPLFYKTYQKISHATDREALLRTFQFYFFPIFFPFIFLVYVDIFTLMLILASALAMTNKRYVWSGIFAVAACLARQDSIVWLIFIAVWGYICENGYVFGWQKIQNFLKKSWIFVAGIVLFVGFVLFNGGVAIGDKLDHQGGLYLGNIYFMLFVIFVLFVPYHIENFPLIIKRLCAWPFLWFLPMGLMGIFLFFVPPLHPFNYTLHFLRDYTLMFIYTKYAYLAFYSLICSFTALSLLEFGLSREALVLFPFAILAVLPEWLIEERYYIVAIAFLMLFRKNKSAKTEYIALAAYIVISAIFFVGIANKWFML